MLRMRWRECLEVGMARGYSAGSPEYGGIMGHLSTIGPSNSGGFGKISMLDEDCRGLDIERF